MDRNHQQPELIDHEAARRNARLTALLVAALAIVGSGIGLGVVLLRPSHHGHHRGGVAAVLILVAVLVLLLGITVPLVMRLYRRPQYSRILQYSWGRRRRVGKALRKGWPVAPEDRPVADAIVRTMRQQWWLPYLSGVIVALYLAQALVAHGPQRWIAIGLVVLYVVLLPWMLWQRRTIVANYKRGAPSEEPRTAPPQ